MGLVLSFKQEILTSLRAFLHLEQSNIIMSITYHGKRILAKQEEAREIINSYRGMESLGKDSN